MRSSARRSKGYQICSRCVMDTTDPDIVFDDTGVCDHCHLYDERRRNETYSGEESKRRLDKLVESIRAAGRGKEYDSVVGISGGVDSCTVLRRAKDMGLRPLAVHFDNGWNSELAVVNIKRLLDALGVDLVTHVVNWEEFRDLQLAFLRAGVPNCEIPTDHGIYATLLRTAHRYRIKYVLSGSNVATEAIMPKAWAYDALDFRHLRAVNHRFGRSAFRTFPTLGPVRFLSYVLLSGIRVVNLLNYIQYDKAREKQELIDSFGWRDYGGKHYESVFTRFYQGYYLPRRFGFDKRRAHLSCLILAKRLERTEALRLLEEEHYAQSLIDQDLRFVLKKFNLRPDDWRQLVDAPLRNHLDYPNSDILHYRLAAARRAFKWLAMRA